MSSNSSSSTNGGASTTIPEEPGSIRAAGESDPILGDVFRRARLHHRLTLRQVEGQIGIPNAYLSQIERGVIRQPNPGVLMGLAELYELNYALIAEWAGYLDAPVSRGGGQMAGLALRLFVDLDPVAQREALDYLESLRNRTSEISTDG